MNTTEKDLLDLLRIVSCGVHDCMPTYDELERMDLSAVRSIAVRHGLEAVVAFVLAKVFKAQGKTEESREWERIFQKGIRRTMLFDVEREEIFSYFEESGIWYMPLKGVILKDFYPKDGMRQMTDNDILYNAAYREKVLTYFEQRGYNVERQDRSADDIATKKPVFNFEMHRSLFSESSALYPYYADVRSRLVSDGQSKYGLRFTDEDFYLYMTAHAEKHYHLSGHGLRFLLDAYVYLEKKREQMDWQYIAAELETLGIATYEQTARTLCGKLFACGGLKYINDLEESEREMLRFVMRSSLFGSKENYTQQRINDIQSGGVSEKKAKLRYVFGRIFLSRDSMIIRYPILQKKPWLLPVYHVKRIVAGVTLSFGKYMTELKLIFIAGKK